MTHHDTREEKDDDAMTDNNRIAGYGQHSHEVPTVPGRVVEIRDGHHLGTAVWLRARGLGYYVFASYDTDRVGYAERCVLVRGQDVEDLPEGLPYGCDLDSPDGLALVGVDHDDDLAWLSEHATVLWDSEGAR